MKILRMYKQAELAQLWGVSQQAVSYKLKHNIILVSELQLIMKAHPEDVTMLMEELKK